MIGHLKLLIAKLQLARFGPTTEPKSDRSFAFSQMTNCLNDVQEQGGLPVLWALPFAGGLVAIPFRVLMSAEARVSGR
jgi:hypothetical protein